MATKSKSRRVSIEVEVEVWLSDIETDDLIAELQSRGLCVQGETDIDIEEIYKQFSFGNESRAVQLTKSYIENATGKILS